MGAVAAAREKASVRNVNVGTYLTDREALYEVRRLGGVRVLKAGDKEIPLIARVRLVNCATSLPYTLRVELREGAWIPFEEVLDMEVVVPAVPAD